MTPYTRISLNIENDIATVQLNRPEKMNGLDLIMFHELDHVSKHLHRNKSIRAVLLTGAGNEFCTGLDVKAMMKKKTNILKMLFKWWPGNSNLAQRVTTNWRNIPVPVIAVIQGKCWGGGLQIILGADFRIAYPDATFSIMESKWGLIPDMGANMALTELIAIDKAKELAMTGKIINAIDAEKIGMISSVDEDAGTRAAELIAECSQRSPDTVGAVKALFNNNWQRNSPWMLAQESWYQLKILLGKNQQIAVKRQLDSEKEHQYVPRKKW